MKSTGKPAQKGFTLIEMSIVIVIIGLLVGGLASMLTYTRNAKLTSMMNESKYYTNAFNQFQARYNAAPGDYATASAAWASCASATATDGVDHNGDGNGLVRATAAAPGNRVEWFYAFQHLALAGFIQGKFTGITTGAAATYYAKIGTNVAGSSVDKAAFLFDNPDFTDGVPDGFLSGDATYFDGQYSNVLIIAGLNDNATNIPNQGFMTPKQALQLDEKYDDGLPGQGKIVTPIHSALANCATTDNYALNLPTGGTAAAAYDTSTDISGCYFILKNVAYLVYLVRICCYFFVGFFDTMGR